MYVFIYFMLLHVIYIYYLFLDEGEQASLSWDLEVPDNLVPDSARAFVSVIGDIMGPSLEVRVYRT